MKRRSRSGNLGGRSWRRRAKRPQLTRTTIKTRKRLGSARKHRSCAEEEPEPVENLIRAGPRREFSM